jgi:hypothetical protein
MSQTDLEEGDRAGRFVIVRDRDGYLHALAAGAVGAVCEVEDGGVVILSGGRMLRVDRPWQG